jgi:hypothetical protein
MGVGVGLTDFLLFVSLFLLCLSFFVLCLFSFCLFSFCLFSFCLFSLSLSFFLSLLLSLLPFLLSSLGVGDHPHSWALDGYRCKRWNGSSEDYGMRWNQGDVVGCLLDLDSMQMKFYLNGEDLGNDGGRWWLQWTVVVPMADDVYSSLVLSFFPFSFFFFSGLAYSDFHESGGGGMYPAVSLNMSQAARFHFGPPFGDFVFPPTDVGYR